MSPRAWSATGVALIVLGSLSMALAGFARMLQMAFGVFGMAGQSERWMVFLAVGVGLIGGGLAARRKGRSVK